MNKHERNTLNQEQAIRHFLHNYLNKPDVQITHGILADMCRYYDADRVCIFELNTERTQISNTYEWRRDGIKAESETFQDIPLERMECWIRELEEKGGHRYFDVDYPLQEIQQPCHPLPEMPP